MNYYFDEAYNTHPFTFDHEISPNWYISSNVLRIAPEFKSGYFPCEKNGLWVPVKDYCHVEVYSKRNGDRVLIHHIRDLPDELTIVIPECGYPIFAEQSQKFIINRELMTIDP